MPTPQADTHLPLNDQDWQAPEPELHEFAPRQSDYCVCIAVINEGERLMDELRHMQAIGTSDVADILIFDGGSSDGSTDLDFLRAQNVRALLVNRGPGRLSTDLRMGFAYALRQGYEGIITIDGNNKDNAEAIPDFIRELKAGYDFIQGSRFLPGGQAINTPFSRLLAIKLIHAPLVSLGAGFRYTDSTNGYRGMSRRYLLDPRTQPFRDVFYGYELIAYLSVRAPRLGSKTKEIPVTRAYPAHGETPTKIRGFKANLKLIKVLLKTILGHFNP